MWGTKEHGPNPPSKKIALGDDIRDALKLEVHQMIADKIDVLFHANFPAYLDVKLKEMCGLAKKEGSAELAHQIMQEIFKKK